MTLGRQLVSKLVVLRGQPIPDEVLRAGRLHMLDAVGTGMAASGTLAGMPYRRAAAMLAGQGSCLLFGMPGGGSPEGAALINGGLIHSLEYDDTHTGSIVHGSAVLASSALAMGQCCGASGASTLGAFIRGWEVLVRIGLASPGGFQRAGFQVTSVGGALAAALVAADLLGLDTETAVHAVGIALSQASGVFEFLTNGSSVKSLHPGWAAHAGIVAAFFAQSGLTGPDTALDGKNGLFLQFAQDEGASPRFADAIEDLGIRWHLLDTAFKLQPCCHYLHPFIEAAQRLRQLGVEADAVSELVCRIAPGAAPIVCLPWEAKQAASGHTARWSLPVVVAAALVEGAITLDTFETELRPAVRALAKRSRWEPLEPNRFPVRFEAELAATLQNGRTLDVRIDDVRGNASRPASPGDVEAKFRANVERVLPAGEIPALTAALLHFDQGGFETLPARLAPSN